jgi:hypothetical protein
MERQDGPVERQPWPDRLKAHVVDTGPRPLLHGYDVQVDLARHYCASDVMLIALTGEAPDDACSRAFGVALTFAAPVGVSEAPAHAAGLARLCGARTAGVVGIAAAALAEQARAVLDEHEPALARLEVGSLDGMASRYAARSADEVAAVQRLRTALGSFCRRVPAIRHDLRLETAIVAVLLGCGIRTRDGLEACFAIARLPVVCSEAFAWAAGDLRSYPMNLPPFEYDGGTS